MIVVSGKVDLLNAHRLRLLDEFIRRFPSVPGEDFASLNHVVDHLLQKFDFSVAVICSDR